MSSTITDSAIILSREPWREADKRASFFTLQHGKIDAIAVGAHKIRSKLAGHLEPIRAVEVMLAQGRNGYKVAQCVTQHNFISTPFDVDRVRLMGTMVRFVNRATEMGHRDHVLYGILFTGLGELQAANSIEALSIYGKHLYALVEHFGYAPVLDRCVVCGRTQELNHFSPHLGGVLCAEERTYEQVSTYRAGDSALHLYVTALLRWRGLL